MFNAVEELAESSNRWKNIAHIPEHTHTDHRPDIGSYSTALQAAIDAHQDGIKPLKRKRTKPGRGKPRHPKRKKTKSKRHAKSEAKDLERGDSSSEDESDSDYEDETVDDLYRARTAWGWLISFVEVKDDEKVSGFHFEPEADEEGKPKFVRDGDVPRAARAQFVKYFTEAMLRQHRTHYYAFYIAETWVRVFRWDRIGCLVSPPIDLLKDRETFSNILYRIARWNAWGFDETATLASDEDIQKLATYSNVNEYLQEYRDMIMEHRAFYPIYKVFISSCNLRQC